MAMMSNANRYGNVAIALHWISGLAILLLVPLGFLMQAVEPASQVVLYRAHAILGLTALFLTVLRVVWWIAFDRKPVAIDGPGWQKGLARGVHVLFYVALLVLGASGIATMALSGAGEFIFERGIAPPPGIFDNIAPRMVHGLLAWLLIVLLVLHVGAVLLHQFRKRDGMLARMLPGS